MQNVGFLMTRLIWKITIKHILVFSYFEPFLTLPVFGLSTALAEIREIAEKISHVVMG